MAEGSPRGICGGQRGTEASFENFRCPLSVMFYFSLTDSTLIQQERASLNSTHNLMPYTETQM
jgi:hypothetical protein